MENNKNVQENSKAENVQTEKTDRVIQEGVTGKQLKNMDNGRKQKVSASYTIRAFGENARKLKEMGYITVEEEKVILEMKGKIGERYMREELGI